MNLGKYVFRRLLLMVPTLLGISLLSFAVMNVAPGGPIEQRIQKIRWGGGARGAAGVGAGAAAAGQYGVSEDTLAALRRQYGFDKPMLERYWLWLKSLARLEFGDSWVYGMPALEVIRERLPVSLQFGLSSLVLTYLVSLGLGLLMAFHEGRALDRATSFALVAASSVPPFMLGIVLLVFLAGGSFLDLFPVGYLQSDGYEALSFWGKVMDRAHHFVLPLACYLVGSFTTLALLCRNSVLDEIRKDYVRAARAKGVPERALYVRHALRNALIPLVTGIGGILGVFLSGSVLVESVFQLHGMGLLGAQAVMARDYNVAMALIFISSVLMLLGNLLGDLVYLLVDPRITFR